MPRRRRNRYHRGEYTSTKTGRVCRHRSGWEEKYMSHLDTDPTVVDWTYEQTIIEYVSNIRTNKVRRYYPDFYIVYSDGHHEVVEIKPRRKLEHRTVKKKTAAAVEWCASRGVTFKILTEVELNQILRIVTIHEKHASTPIDDSKCH